MVKWIVFILLLLHINVTLAYSALIFDCDGVLVDTERTKFLAWKKAFHDIGIDFKENDYMSLVGFDSGYIAKKIQAKTKVALDLQSIIAQKNAIYRELQRAGVPHFKEAVIFLKKVIDQKRNLNLKIGLASSASKAEILENLKQIGVDSNDFDVIISGKDDLKDIRDPTGVNKPKPYIYQRCAEMLNMRPENCLVIEDSYAGVEAAARAGMAVVAIPNQYTKNHDFSRAIKVMAIQNFYHELLEHQERR